MQETPRWPPTHGELTLIRLCEQAASVLLGEDATYVEHDSNQAAVVASIHVVRTARMLFGIAELCSAGYAVEAGALARSILEDLVSLAYMSLEPQARAAQWVEHGEDLAYMSLCKARSLGHTVEESDRTRELDTAFAERKPRIWWSGKSPKPMAEALKDAHPEVFGDFDAAYDLLCSDVHMNFLAAERYVAAVNGVVHIVAAPSNHLLADRVVESIHLAVRLANIAASLGAHVDTEMLGKITSAAALVHPMFSGDSEGADTTGRQ